MSGSSSRVSGGSVGSETSYQSRNRGRRRRVHCKCNFRAGFFLTKKPGINFGRKFYGCENWKEKEHCDFFRWFDLVSQNPEIIQQERDALEQEIEALEDEFFKLRDDFLETKQERDELVNVRDEMLMEIQRLRKEKLLEVSKMRDEIAKSKGLVIVLTKVLVVLGVGVLVLGHLLWKSYVGSM